ncbi:MAG: AAA family ATPase [Anaerolineae bacterium]|nr:AAA family ATPase [Anaerolineae bacterium]
MSLVKTALELKQAGFDVIPDHITEKYPYNFDGWQKRTFTDQELKDAISSGKYAIGVRHQEGLDFDNKGNPSAETLFYDWCGLVQKMAPGIVDRLLVETTPSGGYHVVWKCDEIEGNQKLATRPPTDEEKHQEPKKREVTLIETRGKGGQFMIAPSPGYKVIQGDWLNLPTITPEERRLLLDCARAFSRAPKKTVETVNLNGHTNGSGPRPGDIFNEKGGKAAYALLLQNGWQEFYSRDEVKYLTRPGKKRGVSATFGYVGKDTLYVFSSNASPFEPETAYMPFAIYSILEHGGNFSDAAKELVQEQNMNDVKTTAKYLAVEPTPECEEYEPIFKPLSLTELFNLPSKQWLWGDFIGASDLVMIFGESGKGKTFAAIDLIVSGAAGMPYAGKFEVTKPLKVAYCAGEGVSGLRNRFMAAINKHQVKPDSLALQVYCNVPQLFDDKSAEFVSTFVVELAEQAERPDLVVIDTLHAATRGADENHAKDAGLILAAAKQIVEGLGATVLLVHHSTKAGNSYRGSSALHGAMDTIIQVRMNADGKGEIECYKQKDAEYFPKLYFELEAEHYSQSAYVQWLEASTVELNKEPSAIEKAKDRICDALGQSDEWLNQTAIVGLIDGVGRNNVIKALDELTNESAAIVRQDGKQKLYQLNHNV